MEDWIIIKDNATIKWALIWGKAVLIVLGEKVRFSFSLSEQNLSVLIL